MSERNFTLTVFLVSVLIGLIGFVVYSTAFMEDGAPAAPPAGEQQIFLGTGESPAKKPAFSPSDIPSWLYAHVGAIAAFQVLSLLAAANIASRRHLTRRDSRTILFLCEVPMFLGLFGTLLGVCLTQFTSGSLVAPLAYITTMSGVLLHVLGKLTIWLRLPEELIEEE